MTREIERRVADDVYTTRTIPRQLIPRQIASYERSLQLLEEQAELYVNPNDAPPQLGKDIRLIMERVADLKKRL